MSFILDALKKSELERQRQSIPGLVDAGVVAARPRLPLWAVALGALLAVNLLVLVVVLARGWLFPSPAAPAAAAPVTAATPTPAQRDDGAAAAHFSPLDQPQYAPEIPVNSAPEPPANTYRAEDGAAPSVRAARGRDPLLADQKPKADDYKPDEDEVLPSINELNLSGAQELPELHLDVHVFATKPADRFVYVNMRKYHEGATLQEGPTIERIRRDGVILDYQGLRFLLPRQ